MWTQTKLLISLPNLLSCSLPHVNKYQLQLANHLGQKLAVFPSHPTSNPSANSSSLVFKMLTEQKHFLSPLLLPPRSNWALCVSPQPPPFFNKQILQIVLHHPSASHLPISCRVRVQVLPQVHKALGIWVDSHHQAEASPALFPRPFDPATKASCYSSPPRQAPPQGLYASVPT